jgi:uncharacterized protein GlcG (DUF336 family)
MLNILRLSEAEAETLVSAAVARSEEIGVPMCIAVVDESGNLIAFKRMDGGKVSSISIAVDKAFTAAAARNKTAFYGEVSCSGGPAWGIDKTNDGHFCVIGGGVPVVIDGTVVGAIGVSSGTAVQDIDVAEWAVEQFHVQNAVTVNA